MSLIPQANQALFQETSQGVGMMEEEASQLVMLWHYRVCMASDVQGCQLLGLHAYNNGLV